MKLKLFIQYYTHAGEELRVNIKKADGTISQHAMQSVNNSDWMLEVDAKPTNAKGVEYYYSVHRLSTELRREWEAAPHCLEPVGKQQDTYTVFDRWHVMPEDSFLYSAAYTECIHRREKKQTPKQNCHKAMHIKVRAAQLRQGESLYLVGEGEALGEWRSEDAHTMYEHADNEWGVTLDATDLIGTDIEFKFIIKKDDGDPAIIWEYAANRHIHVPEIGRKEVVVFELEDATFPIGDQRFAGTAIPVFSLRSEGSFGVGDFGDLKKMVDWVEKTGQRLLQVLPINDTTLTHTWTDSYPYSCLSIYALHPMYCDLRQLSPLNDIAKAAEFEALRQELNALSQIDYERVNNSKTAYLRLVFEQEGKSVMGSEAYKKWFKEEEEWLVPYAQYSVLRDTYGTPNYAEWPDHNVWNEEDRAQLTNSRTKIYKEVSFFYYVQYVLACQMKGAHEHARQHNVVLKGDIPIGVNRYGCDAWMEPRYFNLNGQAGAPPDSFSTNGQNWGFPTYNWEEMIKDDCRWWVRRFSNMAKYFDAYRIDHVLGFFRIWEIPFNSVHGLLGQFAPALGMTIAEIEGYGLRWNEEHFLTPFITDWVLDRRFGDKAQYVRETFLDHVHDDRYAMKPEYDTQRKVEAWYEKVKAENTEIIINEHVLNAKEVADLRDTLYALISNVLFLRDHRNPELYHPRITAQLELAYESLWDCDKDAFNRLYNDYFYRRNNHFWYREAMKKLPKLVNATGMLVCAEDLGMVPDCVPWVMDELKILSLEQQSMPKETGLKFGELSHNPYRSVCTISSHDTATMRMWWDEDYDNAQEYFRTRLYRGDAAPHPMPGWLAREIIYRHLACPSMLCIITLQDWLATNEQLRLADANAERINIPANPKHYWRYRMHLTLEELLAADDFNYSVSGLIKETRG